MTAAPCNRRHLLAGLALATLSLAAAAQTPPQRLQGRIERLDGAQLVLRQADGTTTAVTLPDSATVLAVVRASRADIQPGTYLGSAALPQADGSQKALEVHIFPEQMRGAGEGHRPYAPVPSATMTNGASLGALLDDVGGTASLVLKYKDGEKKLVLPADVPIVRYEPGSRADLKPGAAVTVPAAIRQPDGQFQAARINVGRDGVVPQ